MSPGRGPWAVVEGRTSQSLSRGGSGPQGRPVQGRLGEATAQHATALTATPGLSEGPQRGPQRGRCSGGMGHSSQSTNGGGTWGPSSAGEARGDSCPAALGGWSCRHPLPGTDPRPGRPEGEQGCGVNHTVHTYHQGTASPRTNGGVGDPLKPKSPMPQGSSPAAFRGAESRGWPWVFADTVNAAASSWAGDGRRVWPHAPSSPGWTVSPAFAVIFRGGEQQGGGGRVALPRAQESLIKSKETFELSLLLGAVLCSGRLDLLC